MYKSVSKTMVKINKIFFDRNVVNFAMLLSAHILI